MPRYESPYDSSSMPKNLEHVIYEKKEHIAYVTINRPAVRNALQCQLRVMADTAWIGDTHTKVGRLGSAHNLYTALPRTTAAYLTLCNGRLTADECYRQAIVNKVVPRDKLIATCEEMAEMICDSSPLAVQAAVRLYRLTAAFDPSLVSYARQLDQEIAESEEGAEGPRAFREQRKPVRKLRRAVSRLRRTTSDCCHRQHARQTR